MAYDALLAALKDVKKKKASVVAAECFEQGVSVPAVCSLENYCGLGCVFVVIQLPLLPVPVWTDVDLCHVFVQPNDIP